MKSGVGAATEVAVHGEVRTDWERKLNRNQEILRNLEEDLRDILARGSVYYGTEEFDEKCAQLVPGILIYSERSEEFRDTDDMLWLEGRLRARARKATELLSKIPAAHLAEGIPREFRKTRRLLWEAIVDHVLNSGPEGKYLDAGSALALVTYETSLSKSERDMLFAVLRYKFDKMAPSAVFNGARHLLYAAMSIQRTNPGVLIDVEVRNFLFMAIARRATDSLADVLMRLLAVRPASMLAP